MRSDDLPPLKKYAVEELIATIRKERGKEEMLRKNFPHRKQQRRVEAEKRAEARARRGDHSQERMLCHAYNAEGREAKRLRARMEAK